MIRVGGDGGDKLRDLNLSFRVVSLFHWISKYDFFTFKLQCMLYTDFVVSS